MSKLYEYLKTEEIRNYHILNLLKKFDDYDYVLDDNFCIIRIKKCIDDHYDGIYIPYNCEYISEKAQNFIRNSDEMFCTIDEKFHNLIENDFELEWSEECYQFAFKGKEISNNSDCYTISHINLKDIDTVDKLWTYHDFYTKNYITNLVNNGNSSAIYIDKQIAGWCLIHNDGSLGTLFVKEEFRGLGLAEKLLKYNTEKMITDKIFPFFFTVHNNNASISLAKKIGFEKIAKVYWCGIINRSKQ
ncbi:MAG: GNAT family N-acetyltransferase [Candidatus Delongbacteria bacterium]|nr:GNAT family N-acetyltransferase [Candidatus Delongbacteria bacterium]MBN2834669.1 GNAT family N-acetyltransferase [Candidatus Delongbacteria bacterium]